MKFDGSLWTATAVFGASMGWLVFWLAKHQGHPVRDPAMVVPCLVAIVALNVAYWRMSKLTRGWTSWSGAALGGEDG